MNYRFKCWMEAKDRDGFWSRLVTFPCFPFPELAVGYHTVVRVLVCQGNLDGSGSVEVEFDARYFEDDHLLRSQGWEWESYS